MAGKHRLVLIVAAMLAAASAAGAKTLIAAPAAGASPPGTESGAGTLASPATFAAALALLAPGDTLWLRGGVYASARQITIAREDNGTADKPKRVFAYPGEKPVLDFSAQPYVSNSVNERGLQINGSYWHFRGLEIKGSADNGIYVAGNHITIEACLTHHNRDSGIQISRWDGKAPREDWPSFNLILNCESHDNYDAPPGTGENADGFACKLTAGEGNVFRGCVAHHNIDDGWDLFSKTATGPIGAVVIDQCITYANGTLTDGTSNPNGDRNGFKLGGEKIEVGHIVTRSVAFGNGKHGFHFNTNPGAIRMSNNLAFDNAQGNFRFGDPAIATKAIFANNLSFWTGGASAPDKVNGVENGQSNCWWDKTGSVNGKGLKVTAADFALSLSAPKPARKADGAPDLSIYRLAAGSRLIDAGAMPVGPLPFEAGSYYHGAPDLGAVEAGGAATPIRTLRKAGDPRSGGAFSRTAVDGNGRWVGSAGNGRVTWGIPALPGTRL